MLLLLLTVSGSVSAVSLRAFPRGHPPRYDRGPRRDWLKDVVERHGFVLQSHGEAPWEPPKEPKNPPPHHRFLLPQTGLAFASNTFSSFVSPSIKQPEVVVQVYREPPQDSASSPTDTPAKPKEEKPPLLHSLSVEEGGVEGAAAAPAEGDEAKQEASKGKKSDLNEPIKDLRFKGPWNPDPFVLISTGKLLSVSPLSFGLLSFLPQRDCNSICSAASADSSGSSMLLLQLMLQLMLHLPLLAGFS